MSQRIEIELEDEGRIVLPSPVRQQLGLIPGMTLVVEQEAPDVTYLRIQQAQPRLVMKQGVLVVESEMIDDFEDPLLAERDERMMELLHRVGL